MFKKLNVVLGHYGTGKTNFTLNAAKKLALQGKKVTVADLDIVNPYFRSSDYKAELEALGIKIIAPGTAGSTLENPSLPGEIYSVFSDTESIVFLDVGGDDAGAFALGRYADMIRESGDYQVVYVVNKYRRLIESPAEALALMREIEFASKINVTAIVNNSHLSYNTIIGDILSGYEYAKELSAISGLPLLATAAPERLCGGLEGRIENIFPIETLVRLPWNWPIGRE